MKKTYLLPMTDSVPVTGMAVLASKSKVDGDYDILHPEGDPM